jgi:hypothetical protein
LGGGAALNAGGEVRGSGKAGVKWTDWLGPFWIPWPQASLKQWLIGMAMFAGLVVFLFLIFSWAYPT